ncbi:MAG: heme lyase CcmF/NrfE family subunit [Pseudomonadota bacterium]
MLPEIGHFALILAFVISCVQAPILFFGARSHDGGGLVFARRAPIIAFALTAASFFILMHAYATSDFSVVNVVENSHSAKPFIYKLTGTWGNHEGSMLLWVLVLTLFSAILASQARSIPSSLYSYTLGVQALVTAAFFAFILFTSNPFERFSPAPLDGQGLNPLLQDIGLAIHPPFLYLGYVGFSIPFSFAVAALIRGRADAVWARLVRPWALAAWVFLTIGIMLGSWWAYYELGWGGWWAWDPVENASFMPWLAGVALIHSIRVVERRDVLKGWAVLLAISAFSLSLVGTFLVRSGVLTSVHAFAVDPTRGVFILMILGATIGGSLTLFALRAGSFAPTGGFAAISRESALFVNNLLFVAACATVFLGTFYPLFIDVLTGERLSVGAPYFNLVFIPIATVVLALAAAGSLLPWKRGDLNKLAQRLIAPALAALAAALVVAVFVDRQKIAGAAAIALIVWLAVGAFAPIALRAKLGEASIADSWRRARGLPRAEWGAAIAHGGLALFALGVAGIGLWKIDRVALMAEGDTIAVAGYEITLDSVRTGEIANYVSELATFSAQRGDRPVETLIGERRFYPVRGMQTTEAAIRPSAFGDLYISVGENTTGRGWPVRVYFHPLVGCLWWGTAFTALGGIIALTDRGRQPARARRKRSSKSQRLALQGSPA